MTSKSDTASSVAGSDKLDSSAQFGESVVILSTAVDSFYWGSLGRAERV